RPGQPGVARAGDHDLNRPLARAGREVGPVVPGGVVAALAMVRKDERPGGRDPEGRVAVVAVAIGDDARRRPAEPAVARADERDAPAQPHVAGTAAEDGDDGGAGRD